LTEKAPYKSGANLTSVSITDPFMIDSVQTALRLARRVAGASKLSGEGFGVSMVLFSPAET
jgi:hypothetical protein